MCPELGAKTVHESTVPRGDLKTNRKFILEGIKDVIGTKQVNRRTREFAPPWIVQEAFTKELTDIWAETFEEVNEYEIGRDENIITSHVVYKIKADENCIMKLKRRIVPHGNRDDMKDEIRRTRLQRNSVSFFSYSAWQLC